MSEIRETLERMKEQWTQLNYQDKRAILLFNWLVVGNTLVLMFVQIGLGEWSNGVLIETNDSYNSIAMFMFFVVSPIWAIYELMTRANLRGADLRGANLRGANLRGADLRAAYLDSKYLKKQ